MGEELFSDGKRYITKHQAAKILGYHSDYITRLCREGKIAARRINTQWVIDADTLSDFINRHAERKALWQARLALLELKAVASQIQPSVAQSGPPSPVASHDLNQHFRVRTAPRDMWERHKQIQEKNHARFPKVTVVATVAWQDPRISYTSRPRN